MTVFTTIVMVVLVLLLVALLVWFGFELAGCLLEHQRAAVRRDRQRLAVEWNALENTRRVRSVFLDARRAMQREADVRHRFRRGER